MKFQHVNQHLNQHFNQHLNQHLEQQKQQMQQEPKSRNKHKIPPLKLHEELLNEIINEEKDINEQIFREYFIYLSVSVIFSKRFIHRK